MKRYFIILSVVTILALIILVGLKLSQDAIAVIVGVGLGILASIPTSVLLFFVLTRHDRANAKMLQNQQPGGLPPNQQPPVIIVNGGNPPGLKAGQSPYQMNVPSPRTFTIVGEETTELE